jgi:hypothetical protein
MGHNIEQGAGGLTFVEIQRFCGICPKTFETDCSQDGVIDDESLVKMRKNTCLSETSGIPSYSVIKVSVITVGILRR